MAAGRDVLFDIDWQGFRQVQQKLPQDLVGVFLLPPSLVELERRLRGRGTDSEAEVAKRMAAARAEISHWDEFDHVLVNDDLDATVAQVRAILHAARSMRQRQPGLPGFVAGLLAPGRGQGGDAEHLLLMAHHPAGQLQRRIAIIGIGGGQGLGQQVTREGGGGGLLELAD